MKKQLLTNKFFTYFVLALAIIYGILPIDLIPDVPLIGWIDDFGVLGAAILLALRLGLYKKKQT